MSILNSSLLFSADDAKTYVEDVFSTWLYAGNSSTQTITNGIDLAGKGGLVWAKSREAPSGLGHSLIDTVRGLQYQLFSNTSASQENLGTNPSLRAITAFNTTGFDLGADGYTTSVNRSGENYASWTFRKAPKFFDVVTYTGNGSNRTIAHNLGSVPGCIIVKRTDAVADWQVYHRSRGGSNYIVLNSSAGQVSSATRWNSTDPTSTVFSLGTDTTVNASGGTYVAYLFAHDAGGFGDSGNDNIISCGSYTGNGLGTGSFINLGWEPQWILIKRTSAATASQSDNWTITDNMRGLPGGTASRDGVLLYPNTTQAEIGEQAALAVATGFYPGGERNYASVDYIYVAIRRGPMKTPTVATKVFGLSARSGTGANATVTGGQEVADAVLIKSRGSATGDLFASRLTGPGYLETSSTAAEVTAGTAILQSNAWDVMDGVKVGTTSAITNASGNTYINYLFRRAPGFFDVVPYKSPGTGGYTLNHNLAAVPQFIIVKHRSGIGFYGWAVYHVDRGINKQLNLNLSDAESAFDTYVLNSVPANTTQIVLGNSTDVAYTNGTFIAYLFATLAGVSKVFNFTGTGTTLQINCGFTNGARFVMIKRTDSTGDWYVWDSARGIISGNDSYLLLNSTAAEVTNTDYIDPYSAGFEISSTAPAAINASGGSYIGLAVA